jgi:hypothetical protein
MAETTGVSGADVRGQAVKAHNAEALAGAPSIGSTAKKSNA